MNHPNLPVFKWVYHTRPSFFKEKVCYDAKREFHYLRLIDKKNKEKDLQKSKEIISEVTYSMLEKTIPI